MKTLRKISRKVLLINEIRILFFFLDLKKIHQFMDKKRKFFNILVMKRFFVLKFKNMKCNVFNSLEIKKKKKIKLWNENQILAKQKQYLKHEINYKMFGKRRLQDFSAIPTI